MSQTGQRTQHVHGRAAARWRAAPVAALLAAAALQAGAATPGTPGPAAGPVVQNSSLDAPLFYQLLIGEIELRAGEAGNAYEVMLDAARRTKDEALYRRTVEIALQARAGDQALAAARAWRTARPESAEAMRFEIQILLALNRPADTASPLRGLLSTAPEADRPGLIAALPRLFLRQGDGNAAATVVEQVLQPYLARPATRTAARVSLGRVWLQAGQPARALDLATQALADDPDAIGAALLAMDLLPTTPAADALVDRYLQRPGVDPALRLAYVRALTNAQRYPDAIAQLERVTGERPDFAPPWLTLGALRLELRDAPGAEQALERYVSLLQAQPTAPPPAAPASTASAAQGEDDDDADTPGPDAGDDPASRARNLTQAWLLLAQAAEQRGDLKKAEDWLSRIDDTQRALEVQARRAMLMARQGQVDPARALLRAVPEREPGDARAKQLAEAQLLREMKLWQPAYEVLGQAVAARPEDTDLIYEQAMVAEKLDRMDDMERLLRRVIELKPDHQHAYNALGYSLADRGQRLDEARRLIQKALELTPGDPFITDSLGWVEYRMGNLGEATRLLRQAYATRPDTEIAAHLGEVLWVAGQRDEARKLWREARQRDAGNEVLRETLARLNVDL